MTDTVSRDGHEALQQVPDTTTATVNIPLCVDLDGTLLTTDSLHASLWLLARRKPWMLLVLPIWVFQGKARFKQRVADTVTLGVEQLPYDNRVRDFIVSARGAGQPVWLVSGCHQSIAERVADHIGGFAGVLASDGTTNLTSTRKRDELCRRFGIKGYDYIGNSSADLPVWESARHIVVANANARLSARVKRQWPHAQQFPRGS